MRALRMLAVTLLVLAGGVRPCAGQFADRARQPWRTLETPHFRFVFPQPLAPWALPVAARFESVRAAVDRLVGNAPSARVTVVMDDPITISNGLTLPELHEPTILLLATPPAPRTDISDHPGWGAILSVHEYAHAAHMTRPSRNPFWHTVESLPFLPVDVGPIARRAPRWVTEGYATYVEGRLLGSGRPHGVWRAAVLRQWALEGRLPSYAALSASGGYRGGSFAYLGGSAYLEWLLDRQAARTAGTPGAGAGGAGASGAAGAPGASSPGAGAPAATTPAASAPGAGAPAATWASADSALPYVWRRLTARQVRSFGEAFSGVFGGTPEALYDRFRVEVTARAVRARDSLARAGLVEGDTVQALEWETGDPALSRDGRYTAVVLRSRDLPSRVVVWNTVEPPDTAAARRAAERAARLRARDPEDVPAVTWRPPAKKPLATLWASAEGGYDDARFLPDGEHILLTRFDDFADGSSRPDLFLWDWKRGGVRRVTHGAALVAADPAPDGASAVAVRCRWGACDLVRVALHGGGVTLLRAGSPDQVWARPRYSPDGRRIAAALQRDGRWRVVLLDANGGQEQDLGDAGAQRYDPAFLRDGSALVVTSEQGGIPNLEVLPLSGEAGRPITRVTGAAVAPEPAPDGSIYFLRLHARGLDLARVRADARIGSVVALDSALTPVAPLPPARGVAFASAPVQPPHAYGLGHREYRLLPSVGLAGGDVAGRLALASSDAVGRLGWLAQGAFGPTVWRGGSLRLAYRGVRPEPRADLFASSYHPLRRAADGTDNGLPGEVRLAGGGAALELRGPAGAGEWALRAGGSLASLRLDSARATRPLGFLAWHAADRWALGLARFGASAAATGAAGSTGGSGWRRLLGSAAVSVRPSPLAVGLELRALGGAMAGAPRFEQFAVGGEEPPLFDVATLSQQVALPALEPGALVGRQLALFQARLQLPAGDLYGLAVHTAARGAWQRVVGLEQEADTPPIPIARIPGMHVLAGVGYTLDEQPHRTIRFYGMASLRP